VIPLFALLWGCGVAQDWPGEDSRPTAPASTASGSIEGLVFGPEGDPLAGAILTSVPGGHEATSGPDGSFLLDRLLPGEYLVVGAASGLVATWSPSVDVLADQTATVELRFDTELGAQDGLLELRVLDPDGAPLADAVVTISSADGDSTALTDELGLLILDGFGGQEIDLSVQDAGGLLWPRTMQDVAVPELGAVQRSVQLSGRPSDDGRYSETRICVMCHQDIGASYSDTAHARAMSAVEGDAAAGFESGEVIDLGGPTATLGGSGTDAWVELSSMSGEVERWPVAGFIGSGVRGVVPWTELDGQAWPLPIAWQAENSAYPGWNGNGWVAGDSGPWFTSAGAFAYSGSPSAETSAEAQCFGCHVTGFTLEADGADFTMTAAAGSGERWIEAAVGCESCHGPGQDHSGGSLSLKNWTITSPAKLDPARSNDVCGQCHSGLAGDDGTPYPWSATHGLFQPGEHVADFASSAFVGWPNGTAKIPGAQSDEMAASAHGQGPWQAQCSDCHDPHGSEFDADLRQEHLDNTLCLSCHGALSFGGDEAQAEAHAGHPAYFPGNPPGSGRCTGCHMPATAARSGWRQESAAGDVSSHLFLAVPPSDSLADFDAAGASTLSPGEFSPNACQECHSWNDWLFGGSFPGPTGDPVERATHETYQTGFEGMFP